MDEQVVLDHELQVWKALCDGDPELDRALLSADFLGVYPSGFADRDAHAAELRDGPTTTSFELHDLRFRRISEDAGLLCYRADWRPAGSGQVETMYVSSLWQRVDGRLVNTFSQDTPRQPTT